jgi:uncharacterized HAD superfamily protein
VGFLESQRLQKRRLMMAKGVVIFDLDGTLANGKHRNHAIPDAEDASKTWAWDRHNMLAVKDVPIKDTINMCNLLHKTHRIIILTGRCVVAEDLTVEWLARNNVHYDELIMRGMEDHRADTVYKEEELLNIGLDKILCAFDDLEHVAIMIRGLGVTCYLVNKYNKKRINTVDNSEWGDVEDNMTGPMPSGVYNTTRGRESEFKVKWKPVPNKPYYFEGCVV